MAPLEETDHPNGMRIEATTASGRQLRVVAEAVGGGGIRIVGVDGWSVNLDGTSHVVLAEVDPRDENVAAGLLPDADRVENQGSVLLTTSSADRPDADADFQPSRSGRRLQGSDGGARLLCSPGPNPLRER